MIRFIIFFICYSCACYCQEIEDQAILFISDNISLDEDQLENLYLILENPIHLNYCTKNELLQLPFISSIEAKEIIEYRKKKGKFTSVYELQSINQLKTKTIQLMLPFVSVSNQQEINQKYKHRLLTFFQKNKSYDKNQFKHYLKYNLKSNSINAGFVNEHDPGESLHDYISAYLSYSFKNAKLWLGDYDLSLGQGLLLQQSFGFGKSAYSLFKASPTIKVHRSTREYHFNRGIALAKKWKKLNFVAWYSYKKVDGSIQDSNLGQIISLQTTGYHQTESEIFAKNKVTHLSKGMKLSYQNANFKSSIYSNINSWDYPIAVKNAVLNSQFGIGLDYSLTYKNAHFFGEFANLNNKGAYINGCNVFLSPNFSYSFLIRNISQDFNSLQANAFVENSNVDNEFAIFSSFSIKLNHKWSVVFFQDNFQTKPNSSMSQHSLKGKEHFLEIKHKWSKKNRMGWRVQYKREQKLIDDLYGFDNSAYDKQIKVRWQTSYSYKDFQFKSRIQYNVIDSFSGQLFFQELGYKPLDSKWTCKLRYTFYDTDSYNSRVYAYEPDVLYAFSIPAYYQRGQALIFTFKYKFSRKLSAYFKLKSDLSNSYLDSEISKYEFKCLLKWQF